MTSAMPRAAVESTSSALEKPALNPKLPYTSLNLLLFIITKESTVFRNFSIPWWACAFLILPSNSKGMVTIPTVRMSISLAILAMMGAAPVPVPPPIPAVINTILVFDDNMVRISSRLSTADCSPISGLAPAPKPSVKCTPS